LALENLSLDANNSSPASTAGDAHESTTPPDGRQAQMANEPRHLGLKNLSLDVDKSSSAYMTADTYESTTPPEGPDPDLQSHIADIEEWLNTEEWLNAKS